MPMKVTTTPGGVSYGNIRRGEGHGIEQVKLDVSRFGAAEKDADGYLPPGTPVAANGGPVVNTTLAADAGSTDTTIDVATARGMEDGDVLSVDGVAATIAAGGIALGAGAGGSDRVTITAQFGATKTTGDPVTLAAAASTYGFLGPEAVEALSADHFAALILTGLVAQDMIEDNIGRALTAGETSTVPAALRLV